MLVKREKTISHKCGVCSTDFTVTVNIFNVGTNAPYQAFCPACGERAIQIVNSSNKQITIDVNCFVCCEDHSYNLSTSSFWQDEIFALPCGAVNLDICFVGGQADVEGAVGRLNSSIEEIQTQFETEISNNNGACMLSALNHLYDMVKDGKIFCICNDGDIKIEAVKNGIVISCKSCGAIEYIGVENDKELKNFLIRKSVVLINSSTKHKGNRKKTK